MSGTPLHNGIAVRRNRTLLDMVHYMLTNACFLDYLWEEALRTLAYILNQAPNKYFPKTPFV